MRKISQCVVLLALVSMISCDDLFVVNAPEDAFMFSDKIKEVKSSQLENILDTVSGVTSAKGSWEGATVLSPFRYPRLVSVVSVAVTEPLPGTDAWRHYKLGGPSVDADSTFYKLHMRLAEQPNTLPAIKLEADQEETAAPPAAGSLNASEPSARLLLRELALLEGAGEQLAAQPGRRAVLLSLHALPGAAAEGVSGEEAGRLVAEAVGRYAEAASKATGGRALTLLLTQPALSRRTRSLMEDPTPAPAPSRLNLASAYSDDYPVIFNILLITSIFLLYILVAFSIMTAYMDPGKDSIIYRMTNPNMKKNN